MCTGVLSVSTFTIGHLAQQANVNVETIRYYERRGLLPQVPRPASGYRQYSAEYVRRVQFIKRAQTLGFSLKEIAELLELRIESNTVCVDVKIQAEAKLADIEDKMVTLAQMKQNLLDLVQACRENQLTDECPILYALDTGES